MPPIIFRKGLDLKEAVAADLSAAYHSSIVEEVRAAGFTRKTGRLTVHLAREFGFCYGVDRAVDYAYQTRKRFPDKQVFLTGEIIHNPHVNDQLRGKGIRILTDPGEDRTTLSPDDVVILPAFGVSISELASLQRQGCTLVDTTCGSVLNVWKNVRRYAQEGFTAVIHGKVHHEETRATASQATDFPNGHFLIVRDHAEAEVACDFIRHGGDSAAFIARFGDALSAGFDPVRHLERVGCANQTTMLMSESLEIGEMFRKAMRDRYGEGELPARFRAFDTICSATQERQDAVVALLDAEALTMAVVIGGYNSSNTCNLARICAERVPTYHISDPDCLVSGDSIRHRPIGAPSTASVHEETSTGWLPPGPLVIGLTAGASTPNNIVGQVIERLETLAGAAGSVNIAPNSGVNRA
ncbi:MAG TPA: 4-hydroxy-3-methylbut-2-enyl diphosphate reductase [Vicinamibacterales bacterium]|nr:4-hydroxy-3-methylbut-2-enyl diphosphate reductase [Vicinamibacterales bacterium]